MLWQGQELVRVQDPGELKAGMLVFVLCCRDCGVGLESLLLVRSYAPIGKHWRSAGTIELCSSPAAWKVIGSCSGRRCCFCSPIDEGRLYRLQEPPAEENPYLEQPVPTKRSVRT
jgi:hypothetical protein